MPGSRGGAPVCFQEWEARGDDLCFDCLAVQLAASATSDGQTRFRGKHIVLVPRATEFKVSRV